MRRVTALDDCLGHGVGLLSDEEFHSAILAIAGGLPAFPFLERSQSRDFPI